MESSSPKRFVTAEVFHAIVSETDLGPAAIIDDEVNPACFDTIKMMLETGPLADELRRCAEQRIGTTALVSRRGARARREREGRASRAAIRISF